MAVAQACGTASGNALEFISNKMLKWENECIYLLTFVSEATWQFFASEQGSLFTVMSRVFLMGTSSFFSSEGPILY